MSPKPPDILRKSHAHGPRKERAEARETLRRELQSHEALALELRAATPEDAQALARLVNYAGEGLPYYLWQRMAEPGEDAWEIGRRRAAREEGSFSYRNAVVADVGGVVAGCLIGYPLSDAPEPHDDNMPPMFVPLQALEDMAAGTWYINVVATFPEYRGRGIGTELLREAERAARATGRKGLSLVVADANAGARRLYRRMGYRETAQRPMVKEQWENPGENWVLLVKSPSK
jgi:ribosomal protein S18 acetylase RimI-like enzyme